MINFSSSRSARHDASKKEVAMFAQRSVSCIEFRLALPELYIYLCYVQSNGILHDATYRPIFDLGLTFTVALRKEGSKKMKL